MSMRRAWSRTGSLSSAFDLAPPASDVPAFSREVAEGLFVLSPCRPLASRTESKSVVADPAGEVLWLLGLWLRSSGMWGVC